MKTKRALSGIAIAIALSLTTGMFSSCNSDTDDTQIPSSTPQGNQDDVKNSEDPVTLNFMYIGGWSSMTEATSPLFDEIERKTGVRMTVTNVDDDQKQVILAGGDTTDCLMIFNQTDLLPAIEGDLMLPLDDLIEKVGPNVKSTYPERLKMSREVLSNGSGKAYFLPVQAGSEGASAQPLHSIYMVRWDLYKQMNYPKIAGIDEFLSMLLEMKKLEPATPDGKPTYGISVSGDSAANIAAPFNYTYGYYPSNDLVSTDVNTGKMMYAPTDDNSPYWQGLEYYNKAHRMGLLDPDSFTQKGEDMQAKITAGQILSPLYNGFIDTFETNALTKDPNTIEGFQTLPIEGTTYYCNTNFKGGWDGCFVGIPKTCKDPEAVMRVLDYLSTYEGARMIESGIEGEHWTYVDGVPTFTDEVREGLLTGDQKILDLALDDGVFTMITGIGIGELCPDGYPVKLTLTAEFQQQSNRPTDDDYCSYYNVNYPMELFLDLMEQDKIHDHQNDVFDMRVVTGMGSAPEDIARFEAKITDMAVKNIPKLIMAESAESFTKMKQEAIEEFNKAGAAQTREYWQTRHDELTKTFVTDQ